MKFLRKIFHKLLKTSSRSFFPFFLSLIVRQNKLVRLSLPSFFLSSVIMVVRPWVYIHSGLTIRCTTRLSLGVIHLKRTNTLAYFGAPLHVRKVLWIAQKFTKKIDRTLSAMSQDSALWHHKIQLFDVTRFRFIMSPYSFTWCHKIQLFDVIRFNFVKSQS
jgi:hypothetical protein